MSPGSSEGRLYRADWCPPRLAEGGHEQTSRATRENWRRSREVWALKLMNSRYYETPSDDPAYIYQNNLVALDVEKRH
jgi:hypothetical protein